MIWEYVLGAIIIFGIYKYLQLSSKYNQEKQMPKDVKRRVFTRDEVIKVAWQHYEKHGAKCANCSNDEDLDIDHIHPLAKGGHNGLDNLQVLCSRCNTKKGVKI